MISPVEALSIVLKHVRPLQAAQRPVGGCVGSYLAEDVVADRDMPPADRSTRDGYAVRCGDIRKPSTLLRIIGEVAAGSADRPRVRPGACVRILTGANVPPGADAVVMLEQTEERSDFVTIREKADRGANIQKRGEDARKGTVLLPSGTRLGPLQIAVCAAVGKSAPKVRRLPRIGVICTGRELRRVADRVLPHEVRNSNGAALCAAIAERGYRLAAYRTVPDELGRITNVLRQIAGRCDIITLTGGVSVGRYDYVPEAIMRVAARIRFHGVAMKPGKPVLYATLPENRHIFGLPGNPLSAVTTFCEFVLPALRRLAGEFAENCRPVLTLPLARQVNAEGGRRQYILARIIWSENGPRLEPIVFHSSADLVSGGSADGVIAVPTGITLLRRGAMVEFHPWRPLP